MAMIDDFVGEIEVHSEDGIRAYFEEGLDPNGVFGSKTLFQVMVEMYCRSPRFKNCVKAFMDYGLQFDPVLLAVLTDDSEGLIELIRDQPEIVRKKYSLFDCAYTSLRGVSLLHICAEYNHTDCARVLVDKGADVNFKADTDEYGFGGQTPIFHTVNQNQNNSEEMLHFLLDNDADANVTVKGLIWGKTYEWETLMPSVNPISYAMMGMLPQVHRQEQTISRIVTILLKHAYGIEYTPQNVPCAYLK